jgi:acyl-CoA reductase-like NAD-dependent aldehyde dehydrogenase
MKSYPMLIGGEDAEGDGWTYVVRASALIGDTERAFNLKRGLELGSVDPDEAGKHDEVVARCAWGGPSDNQRALEAAATAARQFGRFPQEKRRAIGEDFYRGLLDRADELVDVLVAEGHPRQLAQWEVSGLVRGLDEATLEWYFQQLRQDFSLDGRTLRLVRKPDGVVCINPPQNAAASNSAMGALALLAGNALVVKVPRSAPLGVMFVYREIVQPVLERHGVPPGTLSLVSGYTRKILREWLQSDHVDDVLYFGSSESGLRFGTECYAAGKKPILELSGNDGFLVWRDADLDRAAQALAECFYGSSQICMVPKYAIAHPEIAEDLLERLVAIAANTVPGYPEDDGVVLSPVLKQDRFFDFLSEAREAGCQTLTGGERIGVDGVPSPSGLFLQPTVIRVDGLKDARRLSCVREETFFPMLPVIVPGAAEVDLAEQVLAFMDENAYGLRNSIWTEDEELIESFSEGLSNGGLLKINDSHVGFVPILSTHGGTGRTGGPTGELNYAILRATHWQGISRGAPGAEVSPIAPELRSTPAPS